MSVSKHPESMQDIFCYFIYETKWWIGTVSVVLMFALILNTLFIHLNESIDNYNYNHLEFEDLIKIEQPIYPTSSTFYKDEVLKFNIYVEYFESLNLYSSGKTWCRDSSSNGAYWKRGTTRIKEQLVSKAPKQLKTISIPYIPLTSESILSCYACVHFKAKPTDSISKYTNYCTEPFTLLGKANPNRGVY